MITLPLTKPAQLLNLWRTHYGKAPARSYEFHFHDHILLLSQLNYLIFHDHMLLPASSTTKSFTITYFPKSAQLLISSWLTVSTVSSATQLFTITCLFGVSSTTHSFTITYFLLSAQLLNLSRSHAFGSQLNYFSPTSSSLSVTFAPTHLPIKLLNLITFRQSTQIQFMTIVY